MLSIPASSVGRPGLGGSTPLRANSTILAFSSNVDRSVLICFRANDDFFAIVDRFQKLYMHGSALEPGRLGLHNWNGHVAVYRYSRYESAAKAVLSGYAIVVDLVFR